MSKIEVALLCGGPSLERGISLNSARSVCDHLHSDSVEITPIYFDHKKKPYLISRAQLYSNTPSDFDFKLAQTSKSLSNSALHTLLKSKDLVFPVIHGEFGEDGQIQRILDRHKVPYAGSSSESCKKCFDKYFANEFIKEKGFYTMPSTVLKIHEPQDYKKIINDFFKKHKIKRGVVKPATGGSSIGVHSVNNPEEALEAVQAIFKRRMDTRVVLEPFCQGMEFTVIILENQFGMPVALMPTEIEIDYSGRQVFDYRRKYLSTNQVKYHCPPRFEESVIEKIQIQAEQLFKVLGMRDFARFDGWLLDNGEIWFSDFNPISGMEQNSFLFMQAAQIGLSHRDLLLYILNNALKRNGINFTQKDQEVKKIKKPINVIFGGQTAERQVSVMSGTNVWLKLRNSKKYAPKPYLLDTDGDTVWELPYAKTLNHTVEEISETCHTADFDQERIAPLRRRVLEKLSLTNNSSISTEFVPRKMNLSQFIKESKYVFIGLHGGIGENGELQAMLEKANIPFNGSGSKASQICIDKYRTGEVLAGLEHEGIYVPRKTSISTNELLKLTEAEVRALWKDLRLNVVSKALIIKPQADGCSAGIVKIQTPQELMTYIGLVKSAAKFIPPQTFKDQNSMIDMPTDTPEDFILEEFIHTDKVTCVNNNLKWQRTTDYVEVTIGLLGKKDRIKALNPSLTVASGQVLSLEEKFQGGTGVNITPPPQPFVKKKAISEARRRMEIVAKKLGISGYARIDSFMHTQTGELMIIEANSTPGLTPSTVIFHQGLAETPQMYPLEFLEKIIEES